MNKKEPCISSILVINNDHQSELISKLLAEGNHFTEVPDVKPEKVVVHGLALLVLSSDSNPEGSGFYLCILKKQNRIATGKVRVKGYEALNLKGMDLDKFLEKFPKRYQKLLIQSINSNYTKVSENLSHLLFENLCIEFPQLYHDFERLFKKTINFLPVKHRIRDEDAALEKDALGLCIDIFGIDRANILRSWNSKEGRIGNSFLRGLDQYTLYEDDIISQDLHNIPGYKIVSENITGIVEFENKHGESICVINANRKPIEKATGVDLIYYHRKYEAFTCLQYKMMDKSDANSNYYYNPKQPSHDEELNRMIYLKNLLNKEDKGNSLNDYRFNDCPFFFKLCKKVTLKLDDGGIVTGAYISLNQWLLLLDDDSTKGKKGGTQFGFHTLNQRYLTKQTFIELVQRGMLGTQAIGSLKMARFIESAIEKGHSVIYAIDNSKIKSLESEENGPGIEIP